MHTDVIDLLSDKGIEFDEKGNDCVVSCLNPDHEDLSPSLRIDRDTGRFHCFSCGFKGDIFSHFGQYRSRTYDLLYEVEAQINNILIETRGLDIPESSVPFIQDFRDIKAETFEKFRAFTHTDPEFLNRVVFPIYTVSGLIPGFIGRYTHSNATPKYRVYPPKANLPIYPIPKNDVVVFVEGLFDAINLHDKGMDYACALFGTHNLTWKNAEEKLAPLMASGVTRIALLLDSDGAGQLAAAKLEKLLSAKTDCKVYDVSEFLLPGQDPGNLTEKDVQLLENYIRKVIANQA